MTYSLFHEMFLDCDMQDLSEFFCPECASEFYIQHVRPEYARLEIVKGLSDDHSLRATHTDIYD
jgi:hypothetical protein